MSPSEQLNIAPAGPAGGLFRLVSPRARPGRQAPVRLMLDSDIGPDSDDAGAVALLHALADRGEAEILAMQCSTTSPWGAPCLQALNTYFGRPHVPVGTLKGIGSSGSLAGWSGAAYNRYVARRFPNTLRHGRRAPDALGLYRQVLAREADGAVTLVSIGFLTNLANLLASAPDAFSPLPGAQLVERKVRQLVVMGGVYPAGGREFNFICHAAAAQRVAAAWPTPITFVGAELGERVRTGARLFGEAAPENPVRAAYLRWDRHFAPRGAGIQPHASYDQIAVLYAVRGLGDYWTASPSGANAVRADGANRWQPRRDRCHSYLLEHLPPNELAPVIDDLMLAAAGPGGVRAGELTAADA